MRAQSAKDLRRLDHRVRFYRKRFGGESIRTARIHPVIPDTVGNANSRAALQEFPPASLDLDDKRHRPATEHVPSQLDRFKRIIQEWRPPFLYERGAVIVH